MGRGAGDGGRGKGPKGFRFYGQNLDQKKYQFHLTPVLYRSLKPLSRKGL